MPELPLSPASEEIPTAKPSALWWHWRYIRWWLLPAALVLIVIWWQSVPAYHLHRSFQVHDDTLIPSLSGFLVRESSTTFSLHDWHGNIRWSVVSFAPRLHGSVTSRRMAENLGITFSLSPDGRTFTVATVSDTQTRVQIWHDGMQTANLLLTRTGTAQQRWTRALNNGRVIVWERRGDRWPAMVIEAGQIIARGAFPSNPQVAPDGATVASVRTNAFEQYGILIEGTKLLTKRRFHDSSALPVDAMPGQQYSSSLFARGVVLLPDGTYFNALGTRMQDDYWQHETVAPGGYYTLQHNTNAIRVFSPITTEAWSFTVSTPVLGGDATPDGQHALIWAKSIPQAALKDALQSVSDRVPQLAFLTDRMETDYLALYTRPGRRRAILRMSETNAIYNSVGGSGRCWYPSPDGHAIAMTIMGIPSQCLLFRY